MSEVTGSIRAAGRPRSLRGIVEGLHGGASLKEVARTVFGDKEFVTSATRAGGKPQETAARLAVGHCAVMKTEFDRAAWDGLVAHIDWNELGGAAASDAKRRDSLFARIGGDQRPTPQSPAGDLAVAKRQVRDFSNLPTLDEMMESLSGDRNCITAARRVFASDRFRHQVHTITRSGMGSEGMAALIKARATEEARSLNRRSFDEAEWENALENLEWATLGHVIVVEDEEASANEEWYRRIFQTVSGSQEVLVSIRGSDVREDRRAQWAEAVARLEATKIHDQMWEVERPELVARQFDNDNWEKVGKMQADVDAPNGNSSWRLLGAVVASAALLFLWTQRKAVANLFQKGLTPLSSQQRR
jgi:hypothetical protein